MRYSSSYYDYDDGISSALGLATGLVIFDIILGILLFAAAIVVCIAMYKLFKKANREGYESLIPMHELFVLFQIAGINPKWILGIVFGSVILAIPILGWIIFIGYAIFINVWLGIRLAKAFGKGTGFGVGIALLPFVFYPILAFGNAQYVGFNMVENTPGQDKSGTQNNNFSNGNPNDFNNMNNGQYYPNNQFNNGYNPNVQNGPEINNNSGFNAESNNFNNSSAGFDNFNNGFIQNPTDQTNSFNGNNNMNNGSNQ